MEENKSSQPSVKTPQPTNKHTSANHNSIIKTGSLLLLVLAFCSGIIGGVIGSKYFGGRITSLNNTSQGQQIVSSQSELISKIAKDVSPSTVSINVKSSTTQQSIFGDTREKVSEGAGSGIILSNDGVVMTNKHVIPENAKTVSVTTSDGKTYDNVSVTARDPRANYDIAFLKINGVSNLTPAKLGDSSKMQVGSAVVAIGYALGEFSNTVTSGIISGTGRPITAGDQSGASSENLTNLFQTDAAINPGNSGGPLVNMNGEVIGINTAVAGDAQNIGFSIPIDDVKAQVGSILGKGKLEIPYLGVRYVMLTEQINKKNNIGSDTGAWLKGGTDTLAVISGSPADKAGLKEGDVILKVNGKDVNENNPLGSVLGAYKVGDEIEITYLRDGKQQTTKTKLELSPQQ